MAVSFKIPDNVIQEKKNYVQQKHEHHRKVKNILENCVWLRL